ncbi:Hypothetical predicted protein [Octopus vulgaris]|uniref:Uncharacterized protein n=1 Tax=Octopus vulgaris TaxID=6645 RepID=A0AA36BLZ5_OCTVU|nr:Hypothetical predicted protein [Octopus vulgaris]
MTEVSVVVVVDVVVIVNAGVVVEANVLINVLVMVTVMNAVIVRILVDVGDQFVARAVNTGVVVVIGVMYVVVSRCCGSD